MLGCGSCMGVMLVGYSILQTWIPKGPTMFSLQYVLLEIKYSALIGLFTKQKVQISTEDNPEYFL